MFSMQMLFCLTTSNVLYLKRVFIKCKAIHEKYRSACFSVSLSTMFYLHTFTLLLLIPSNWLFGRLKCSFKVITSNTQLFYECTSRNLPLFFIKQEYFNLQNQVEIQLFQTPEGYKSLNIRYLNFFHKSSPITFISLLRCKQLYSL